MDENSSPPKSVVRVHNIEDKEKAAQAAGDHM